MDDAGRGIVPSIRLFADGCILESIASRIGPPVYDVVFSKPERLLTIINIVHYGREAPSPNDRENTRSN